MPTPLILIVDDDAAARYGIRRAIEAEGRRTREAESGERCLELLSEDRPALVLLDVSMPGMGGIRCLEEIARQPGHPPVVMLTAFGNERCAVECLRKGAYDYLPKPYEVDELRAVVARAIEKVALEQENRALRARLETTGERKSLGISPAIVEVDRLIDRLAPADVTVLVSGESGTGKELVAGELHRRSSRRAEPFVAVNCAALPEELLESELFGHEKGAFTGARRAAQAAGSSRPTAARCSSTRSASCRCALQTKLLRVLAGAASSSASAATSRSRVDVRIVAATNRDLRGQVERGDVPRGPVLPAEGRRDRACRRCASGPEDIAPLAQHFLRDAAGAPVASPARSRRDALRALMRAARWPGNVRELKNAMEYAAVAVRRRQRRAATCCRAI